ncbi:MAG: hypothetical protein AAGA91_02360 [Pseudomonadota bacterium]
MFLLETLAIVVLVYLAPAMALRPSLLSSPETALAIPFVSVAWVFVLQSVLAMIGLYSTGVVQFICIATALVAAYRLVLYRAGGVRFSAWSSGAIQVLLVAVALCIYFSPMLLLYGFDKDDEIYTWNMWAIQHFLGEPIDFSYTVAPYPQLLPKLLSFCYMLLGDLEAQNAVKSALIIFPFVFFSAIGVASSNNRWIFVLFYSLLMLFVLRDLNLKHLFDDGMPDTMMATGVCLSALYFLLFQAQPDKDEYLWLAALCASVSVLSKQPALLWAVASLPIMTASLLMKRDVRYRHLLISLIPAVIGIVWMLTEGRDFEDNAGVTDRSFAGRAYMGQLLYSVGLYFVRDWQLTFILLLGLIACFRRRGLLNVLILYTLPALVAWLLFASYDHRAGLPAIMTLILFIARSNYLFGVTAGRAAGAQLRPVVVVGVSVCLLGLALQDALSSVAKHPRKNDPGFEFGNAMRNNFVRMFSDDADRVYEALMLDEQAMLWSPTRFMYGLLYGYREVARPLHQDPSYSATELLQELRSSGSNFAASAGSVPNGRGGAVLEQLAKEACPKMFELFAGPSNYIGVKIYRVDVELLNSDYCAP